MALTFISQSVASAIIDNLVDTCSSYLKACPAASGMQDELERLQYALPQVQAVMTAVEECAPAMMQNKGLDRWLWQLRDAVENAEDVLDELEYYELEKRIRDGDDKVRGNILSEWKIKFDSFIKGIFPDDTLKRLREAVKGLDRVVASIGPFLQIANGIYGPNIKRQKLEEVKNARETSSFLIESEVLGRDKERDTIVEWLIRPVDGESEGITFNVSAYTIVGMGGLGKTTLAQLIYHDERVKGYFDLIIWVCISQDFNAAAIIRKMLEVENSGKSLNALHEDLKQKLTSKRFLLILDDVWNDNNMVEWEKLVAPLKFGQTGSKTLLTTRMNTVADLATKVMKCKQKSLVLNELEKSDCVSLFNKHAFLGANPDDYKNLQPIGEQIVKKLRGCPLAIKVMGGLLNSYMNYDYWKRILKEDTMTVLQEESDIMTVLRLSYDHLPTKLQVCFRYCSVLPQYTIFTEKELVYMWMGSGLISQSINESRRPEDIGEEYFNLLIRKSFLTLRTSDNRGGIFNYFVMHDLLRDLAKSVSQGECIRIGGDVVGITIPQTVRHLCVQNINLLSIRVISKLKNLRTLFIHVEENHEYNTDHLLVFNEVIKGFKNLRSLRMRGSFDFYKMGDALDRSVHLRYLSLWSSGKRTIGSITEFLRLSVYRLYHLQYLGFSASEITNPAATDIIEWDGLTNLVNLRSLTVPDDMERKIPYVSKLPFICQLNNFFVGDKSGHKISELMNLSDLRDNLRIRGLENVRTSEEAMEAKLNEKEYLESLTLEWSKGRSNCVEMDEQLLDNLCPHINLKRLCIEEYQGVNSPRWMSDLSLINNLTSIELMYCKGWEHLPPLGQLPFLNYLQLEGLHAVKKIDSSFFGSSGGGCAFPSLKGVVFEDLSNLEELIGIDDGCMFPKLHTMRINKCPNLMGIPTLSRSLRNLRIYNAGLTALQVINQDCGNNNQEYFKALERLDIQECEKLEYIPTLPRSLRVLIIYNAGLTALQVIDQDCRNNNQEYFKALERLSIGQCEKLECVPPEFFSKSNPLRELYISGCPKLTTRGISDIQLPSTLKDISIGSCGDLEEPLLRLLPNLASFTSLDLIDCASITSLPTAQVCARWTMLSRLDITNCKKLSSLGGIQALVSLRWLQIEGCDKLIEVARLEAPFPNDVGQENAADCFLKLGRLLIDHHALLLIEPLRSLSTISEFILFNASQLTSLPEEWLLQNHSALKELEIRNAVSLQSLPQSMTQLCSLKSLLVGNAKLIRSLPDLPTSLRSLCITGCHPELKERCQENIGLDWPKIANIPKVYVRIDLIVDEYYF